MLPYLYQVLSTALVLQGAFAASLERRSPAMTVPSTSPCSQSAEYDARACSPVAGVKDRKARRSDARVPGAFSSSSAAKVNSEASYRHLGVRGFDTPYEATTLAHVVRHGGKERMTRRSDAQATSDVIGLKTKPPGMSALILNDHSPILDDHSPGIGHGGEGQGEGGGNPPGGGKKLGTGEGNKRRSVTQASSDLITSEAEINHDEGHVDDRHTRQFEAPMLTSMPRPSH